jgi:NAD(P)-dependent dehydrogenase (short-subunit alcohol dehydrogenase family)
VSLCATNTGKADAALLDDGVADTLASGNTSAGYQPSCYPPGSAATTTSSRSRLASLTKRGLRAAARSLAMDYANRGTRVNAVVPGNHQDADASRRPTSWAPCIRLAAWLRYPTS